MGKKILSLVCALCLVASMFTIGIFAASAEETGETGVKLEDKVDLTLDADTFDGDTAEIKEADDGVKYFFRQSSSQASIVSKTAYDLGTGFDVNAALVFDNWARSNGVGEYGSIFFGEVGKGLELRVYSYCNNTKEDHDIDECNAKYGHHVEGMNGKYDVAVVVDGKIVANYTTASPNGRYALRYNEGKVSVLFNGDVQTLTIAEDKSEADFVTVDGLDFSNAKVGLSMIGNWCYTVGQRNWYNVSVKPYSNAPETGVKLEEKVDLPLDADTFDGSTGNIKEVGGVKYLHMTDLGKNKVASIVSQTAYDFGTGFDVTAYLAFENGMKQNSEGEYGAIFFGEEGKGLELRVYAYCVNKSKHEPDACTFPGHHVEGMEYKYDVAVLVDGKIVANYTSEKPNGKYTLRYSDGKVYVLFNGDVQTLTIAENKSEADFVTVEGLDFSKSKVGLSMRGNWCSNANERAWYNVSIAPYEYIPEPEPEPDDPNEVKGTFGSNFGMWIAKSNTASGALGVATAEDNGIDMLYRASMKTDADNFIYKTDINAGDKFDIDFTTFFANRAWNPFSDTADFSYEMNFGDLKVKFIRGSTSKDLKIIAYYGDTVVFDGDVKDVNFSEETDESKAQIENATKVLDDLKNAVSSVKVTVKFNKGKLSVYTNDVLYGEGTIENYDFSAANFNFYYKYAEAPVAEGEKEKNNWQRLFITDVKGTAYGIELPEGDNSGIKVDHKIDLPFNDDTFSGATSGFKEGGYFYNQRGDFISVDTLNEYNLGTQFGLTANLVFSNGYPNYYGEHASMYVGKAGTGLELRIYSYCGGDHDADKCNQDTDGHHNLLKVGTYDVCLYYKGQLIGNCEGDCTEAPNGTYTLKYNNGKVSVDLNGETLSIKLPDGSTSKSVDIGTVDYSRTTVGLGIAGNWHSDPAKRNWNTFSIAPLSANGSVIDGGAKTGDTRNIALAIAIMLGSASAAGLILLNKKQLAK